jgi:hypothetical protein
LIFLWHDLPMILKFSSQGIFFQLSLSLSQTSNSWSWLTKLVVKARWWDISTIPALRRLRQKDREFKASLGYTARPCLKIKH